MFLRDRKKTEKHTRWVAIIMVIVFALGFVLLSVGSSAGGNVLLACDKQETVSEDSYAAQKEQFYLSNIEDNPQDTGSMVGLAQLYVTSFEGRTEDAMALLDQAIAVDPANVPARLVKAELLKGNPTEALNILNEAAAIAPDNPEVFLQLGLSAKAAGQNAVAIDAWNRFLELDPDNNLADTIRGEISALKALPPVTTTETATAPAAPAQP